MSKCTPVKDCIVLQPKVVCKVCKLVANAVKAKFSKYVVVDGNGTKQYCWTLKGALTWLPYCLADSGTVVINRKAKTVAVRGLNTSKNGIIQLYSFN
jgi:hypothetical protein